MYRDLTHDLETGVQTFPGDPAVSIDPAATIDEDGYRVAAIRCGTHSGTHIDAPSHTEPDGETLDEYPVDQFVFDARVVDCTRYGDREPIEPDVLPADEDGDLLVFRTGWADHWGTDRYLDHPYLAPETADRCRAAGWSVGVDALNPDPTPTDAASPDEPSGFPVHRTVLGDGLFIIENLTNLAGLDRCELVAFPLAIDGADGSPIRAVARTR